jgi:hypothetical protein
MSLNVICIFFKKQNKTQLSYMKKVSEEYGLIVIRPIENLH